MGLLSWILLGLIAGVIANFLMGGGVGLLGSIVLGIVGAVVGGYLASLVGVGDVTGLNLGSIVISVIGACIVLFVVRGLRGADEPSGSDSRPSPSPAGRPLRQSVRSRPAPA